MKRAEDWIEAAISDCKRLIAKHEEISRRKIPTYDGGLTLPLSDHDLKRLRYCSRYNVKKHLIRQDEAFKMIFHFSTELDRLHQLRLYLDYTNEKR